MSTSKTKRRSPVSAAPANPEFVITRVFDAPREVVWKAWTEPERLTQWWGPKGCTIRLVKLDVRPGGIFHYAMQFKAGNDMWGRFIYREIAAPERIVFVNSFSDANGGITRAPFAQLKQAWPLEVLNTVTFTEQGGKTTLTLRGGPINVTKEEIETFAAMFDSMRQGFGGSFDKLAEHLATAPGSDAAPKSSSQECSMKAEPQEEHAWLQKLVGDWTFESECMMGPGKPPERFKGIENVRMFGGFWMVAEGEGEMPGGGTGKMVMTLGYDPLKKRYVGNWVGTMMSFMFVYDGTMDEAGKVLTLDAEGPSFSGNGKMAKYQDVIEIKSSDHRTLTSRVLAEDGTWNQFMTAHYRRKA